MCQNYWHRAQRDATTARLRRALTGDSLERTRAARSRHRATARCNYHAAEPRSKTCVFPFARQREWMCQNYGHRAQRDATTARLRRALTDDSLKRTRYRAFQLHAATPRHTRATRDTRSLRSLTAKSSYRRRFLILRCRLFLSLRSRIRQVLDCSPTNRERELGLDRRETG